MTRQAVALWDAMPAERAAAAYADLIINRVERRMPTDSWSINWDDAPTDQKVYPSAQRLVLPTPTPDRGLLGGDAEGLRGPERADVLADLLHLSYGLLSQRSRVNCNDHPEVLAEAGHYRWGRGAASGGGRYTVSWAARPTWLPGSTTTRPCTTPGTSSPWAITPRQWPPLRAMRVRETTTCC